MARHHTDDGARLRKPAPVCCSTTLLVALHDLLDNLRLPLVRVDLRCEGGGECVTAADYDAVRVVAARCEKRDWASEVGVWV